MSQTPSEGLASRQKLILARLQGLGLKARQPELYLQAFTHSSVVNEWAPGSLVSNERLEYLGDAMLGAAAAEHLYRRHAGMSEGQLSKRKAALVAEASLAQWFLELDLAPLLLLSKGEEKGGGRARPALCADALEAFLGALYLDQGFSTLVRFLEPLFDSSETPLAETDPKSKLQEHLQRRDLLKPSYIVETSSGPDHARCFSVAVFSGKELLGHGQGLNKRSAEKQAAADALSRLEKQGS